MDLGAYRLQAETFLAELTGEYRRHYAGLKTDFKIEPIYAAHAGLFTARAVQGLEVALGVAPAGSDQARAARMLRAFAVEGRLGASTKELEAEIARREATLVLDVEGRRIGFRESSIAEAAEPDPAARAAIARARHELIAGELNPLHEQVLALRHAGARALGHSGYAAMCAALSGIDLGALRAETSAFLAASEAAYPEIVEAPLRRATGTGLAGLRRSDLGRFFRAAGLDAHFAVRRLLPSLRGTLAAGAIDPGAQPNVALDTGSRPGKSPRAFCAPVRVPDEVHLVIAPSGGRDDFSALFHEAGHTEHYAHVRPELDFAFRALGDNAITEAYAFLLQGLIEDPRWLERHLGLAPNGAPALQIAEHARAERLIYLRRYAAKLAYELELHAPAPDLDGMPERYAAHLGAALQIEWPAQTWLTDVDPMFYCACYLRAWALETHLRRHLRGAYGAEWFAAPGAWEELRELWAEGQRMTPEELLALTGEGSGARLDFRVVAEELLLTA